MTKERQTRAKRVLDSVALILHVAATSGNLKGTYVRDFKKAAATIKEAAAEMK